MQSKSTERLDLPACPRCDSASTELVSKSPVAGAWEVYNCGVCFYSWRSSEPEYAVKASAYNSNFKIDVAQIANFAQVPTVPALREKAVSGLEPDSKTRSQR